MIHEYYLACKNINNLDDMSKSSSKLLYFIIIKYKMNYTKNNTQILKSINNCSEKFCMEIIKINSYLIKYIDSQTNEMCLLAIKKIHTL